MMSETALKHNLLFDTINALKPHYLLVLKVNCLFKNLILNQEFSQSIEYDDVSLHKAGYQQYLGKQLHTMCWHCCQTSEWKEDQ